MSLAGAHAERTPLAAPVAGGPAGDAPGAHPRSGGAPGAQPRSGGVCFVAASRQADLCAELRGRRYLIAPVEASEPGRLRHAVDDAVEGALAMRGALPPAIGIEAALDLTIRDQVFRARALGAAGLALTLPRLGDLPGGLLDVSDGLTLSAWLSAAKRAPLLLVLDEHDREARVLAPVPIGELVSAAAPPAPESTPPPSGEVETRSSSEPASPPPPVLTMPRRGVMRKRSLRVEVAVAEETTPPAPILAPLPVLAPAPVLASSPALALAPAVEPAEAPEAAPHPDRLHGAATFAPAPAGHEPARPDPAALRSAAALMAPVPPMETPAPEIAPDLLAEEPAPPPQRPRREPARRAVDAAEWRQHALELDKARGPKPVSTIERLFAVRYMPLVGAVSRGEGDAAVRGVVDAWRTSFEHSYREAFSALRVTGKRPPMVFDAPDIAARIARLNGARATKLVLVDAMRFDVGERVGERLKERLAGRAVCVERMLLWAALPTTTQTQLALLARGPDALRDAEPPSEPDPEIVRGRAVSTLRRDRVGSREVMKLDLVEARLRSSGPGYDERLDALADEVAPILVKYIETLPPRTLFFLFGDHGFRLPSSPDGRATGPATQGGVSPEEVLVPAQAWLVGGVH